MAYVKIPEWTPEQVADWITGLEDCLQQYVSSFLNNEIDGRRLLMLARDDLQHLSVSKLGHQELLLEAAEQLRYSYYHLDDENLQWLAVRLSCKARSLSNDLIAQMRNAAVSADGHGQDRVATTTLSAVADVLHSALCLASWLDKQPFPNQQSFRKMRSDILEHSVELATHAQRDKFAERPNKDILKICLRLDKMCDKLVKESTEPLILQPASLDVATIKKKANEELGIEVIIPLYTGIHTIESVKLMSPAAACGRIKPGDEIVQVNYQTVVGWQLKRLVDVMKEDSVEVVFTLKKCPKHSTNFARIFPHHLLVPSKKSTPKLQRKTDSGRSKKVPASKPPPLMQLTPPKVEATTEEDDDDSTFLPEVDCQPSMEARLDIPKLHVALQRRATITGASPTNDRPPVRMDELWQEVKRDQIMRSMSHDITATSAHMNHLWHHQSQPLVEPRLQQRELVGKGAADASVGVSQGKSQNTTRPVTCIGSNLEMSIGSSSSWKKWTPIGNDAAWASKEDKDHRKPENTKIVELPSETSDAVETLGKSPDVVPASNPNGDELRKVAESETSQEAEVVEIPHVTVSNKPEYECAGTTLATKGDDCSSVPSASNTDEGNLLKKPAQHQEAHDEVTSYQVVIIGGVPQKCPSPSKLSGKSNASLSPKLRGKTKLREFANRRISCKDLGHGDCQGWLYRGRVTNSLLHQHFKWVKRWCVLKNSGFYVYELKSSLQAECVICLIGFSCSPETNCKSKKYAFKVYHSGTSFYFASSSQADMSKWMNKIGLATISYDAEKCSTTSEFATATKRPGSPSGCIFYSDTDDELENKPLVVTDDNIDDREHFQSSDSTSSLSSASSYHSPLESLSPSSSVAEDAARLDVQQGHKNVSHVSGEENKELTTVVEEEQRVDTSPSHSVQTLPSSSSRSSTSSMASRVSDLCETRNPHVVVVGDTGVNQSRRSELYSSSDFDSSENPLLSRTHRAGTLPILPSRKAQAFARAIKGSGTEPSRCQSKSGESSLHLSSVSCSGPEPAKMSLAFEMNLDTSSSFSSSSLPIELQMTVEDRRSGIAETRRSSTSSQTSQDSTRSLPISALKLFGSPKFVKKFTGHRTKSESKIFGKSAKEAPEPLVGGTLPSPQYLAPPEFKMPGAAKPLHGSKSDVSERRLLGSPKLVRAIYRAMHHKKTHSTVSEEIGSSVVAKRLSSNASEPKVVSATNLALLQQIRISSIPSHPETDDDDDDDKGTSVNRLDSCVSSLSIPVGGASGGCGTASQTTDVRVRAQASQADSGEFGCLRSSRKKPAMGVSMIGKQRRSSSQSSDSRSSHSHHYHPYATTSQATQTDNGAKVDGLTRMAQSLHEADLHLDGTKVSLRRTNSALRPHPDRRRSQRILQKRALQRTLVAKERELAAIDSLLDSESITSGALKEWLKRNSHIVNLPKHRITVLPGCFVGTSKSDDDDFADCRTVKPTEKSRHNST